MKRCILFYKELFIVCLLTMAFAILASAQKSAEGKELNITKIELGYPCPGIPFYHFKAELELPESSIIEVEAAVSSLNVERY